LQEVVNEAPQEKRSGLADQFTKFVKNAKLIPKVLRHPREWLMSDKELIKSHDMNVKEVKEANGKVIGYELVTCSNPVWNEDKKDYDPPYEKCFKIDIADLQLLATKSDYVRIEELAAWQHPPKGWNAVLRKLMAIPGALFGAILGYENTGLVLAACERIIRMMFVRDVVTLSIDGKYCKDKWHEPWWLSSVNSPDAAYAVGVKCESTDLNATEDEDQKRGINAAFDFELVELFPTWNAARNRNDMNVAIRGGYNLQFCRVVGTGETLESGALEGQVICDLDAPVQETTHMVQPDSLPASARFSVEHIGARDRTSSLVVETGTNGQERSNKEEPRCIGADCNSTAGVMEDLPDRVAAEASNVPETLVVNLRSQSTGRYCGAAPRSYRYKNALWRRDRLMLTCDHAEPVAVTLSGNIDPLTPSRFWEVLLILVFSSIFGGIGFAKGGWAMLFAGASAYWLFACVAIGGTFGWLFAKGVVMTVFNLDGVMLRYLLKTRCQGIGQGILATVESALVFEFARR
jgi:hypothetical protein